MLLTFLQDTGQPTTKAVPAPDKRASPGGKLSSASLVRGVGPSPGGSSAQPHWFAVWGPVARLALTLVPLGLRALAVFNRDFFSPVLNKDLLWALGSSFGKC